MNWEILPHGKGRLRNSFFIATVVVGVLTGLGFGLYAVWNTVVANYSEEVAQYGVSGVVVIAFVTFMVYTFPN